MEATRKMQAFGMAALADAVCRSESIVYRWRKALNAGQGIRDVNKRALIKATAGSPYAIVWSDFEPAEASTTSEAA